MGKAIGPGDHVLGRLFNTPDGKFYGPVFEAVVLAVKNQSGERLDAVAGERMYTVTYPIMSTGSLDLHRNEIKCIVKRG